MNEPKSGEQNIPSVTEPSGGAPTLGVKPSAILSGLHSELKVLARWLEPQAKSERIREGFMQATMELEDLILDFRLLEQAGWRAKGEGSWPLPGKPESDQGLP
jgi:hypothetical protein